jgi:hypothetical protein
MTYHPHGKEPYQDAHEPGYNDPYTPGETEEWLRKHMDDAANKPSKPVKIKPRKD